MDEMYEVLRFIEHGTQCRQSVDCVEGSLLIYYLRDNPGVHKQMLFDWFRQIGMNLDQYHRCRKGQNYRFLNPYSLVVTEDGKLLLLNLDAQENEFVMKKMQQRALRTHFVKPVFSGGSAEIRQADLFAYGKTLQFMLAYSDVAPPLLKREEMRLSRIIDRCIGVRGKQYGDIAQVIRDLPVFREKVLQRKRVWLPGAGPLSVLSICLVSYAFLNYRAPEAEEYNAQSGDEKRASEEKNRGTGEEKISDEAGEEKPLSEENSKAEEISEENAEESVENAADVLEALLLENTASGNQSVLILGREMELEAVRCLAAAYEREAMPQEAAQAYGRLLDIESHGERIESAGIKKMKLEAGMGQYARAVLTGEEVLERIESSEEISRLMDEYEKQKEGAEENSEEQQKK